MSETRPGVRTTEFWLVLLANVLPELGAIDLGNTKTKAWLHIVTIVGYAISRGLAKNGVAADATDPLADTPVEHPASIESDQGDAGQAHVA
jgi:hypothetical protein